MDDTIPDGWAVARLPDLIGNGGLLVDGDWVESKDQDPDGEIRLTQLADIGDGFFRDRSNRFMTEGKARLLNCTFLEAGDIMIARMPDPLGRACVFPGGTRPCVTVVDVCILRSGLDEVDSRWLMNFINAPDFRVAVWGLQAGSTRKRISKKNLCTIDLPVPPTAEQHRIVSAIESYFTRLDDAVATLSRVERNLKRYRASVLKSAVEGRLVPTEAALAKQEGRDYEPASVLLERILTERRRRWTESGKKGKYQEPAPPDTTGLPELPEGWCWATVEQLTTGDRSSGYGVLVPGPDIPDGVPLVRVGDIHDGRVQLGDIKRISKDVADQFQRTYLRGGELLISLVGSIGRTAVAPTALAGANVARAVGVIPIAESLDCRWVERWFRSPMTQARMIGLAHEVARKTLNLEDVRCAVVAVPPRAEQTRIVDAVSDIESVNEKSTSIVDFSRQRLDRLRQSILKWAFEGKLADQDPSDESASVLLERIKAERDLPKSAKKKSRA